jgi:hypothetical protein
MDGNMELTTEQFTALPDYAKAGFAESDGKYIPVKDAALKSTLDNLDKEKRALESKVGELTVSEEKRMSELEAAKVSARDEAIQEAAKKGNWEEQERLLREKFADELKREKESVRGEVTKEFTVKQSSDALKSDVKLLASELAVDDSAKYALEILISQRAKIDDNGNRIYLGDDGSALSITDLKAFKEEFSKSPTVARLVKGLSQTQGGGLLTGGALGGSAAKTNAKAELAKKNRDGVGLLSARLNEHFNK